MGDAPGMRLVELQQEIRRRLGPEAQSLGPGVDEVVATTLRFWPEKAMSQYARRGLANGPGVLDAMPVIWCKVREDLEARWGTDATTKAALDVLVHPAVVAIANFWFSSPHARVAMRCCIVEAHRQRA